MRLWGTLQWHASAITLMFPFAVSMQVNRSSWSSWDVSVVSCVARMHRSWVEICIRSWRRTTSASSVSVSNGSAWKNSRVETSFPGIYSSMKERKPIDCWIYLIWAGSEGSWVSSLDRPRRGTRRPRRWASKEISKAMDSNSEEPMFSDPTTAMSGWHIRRRTSLYQRHSLSRHTSSLSLQRWSSIDRRDSQSSPRQHPGIPWLTPSPTGDLSLQRDTKELLLLAFFFYCDFKHWHSCVEKEKGRLDHIVRLAQTSQSAWITPGTIPRIVRILEQRRSDRERTSGVKQFTYMFKKKCVVHCTLMKAAIGGKKIAKSVNRLEHRRH